MPHFRSARKLFLALIRSWEFKAPSIQQKFRFEMLEIHVHNGRVHSGFTDPTQLQATACLVIVLVLKQDTKVRYWGQQFCQMERDLSVLPTEMTGQVKVDHFQR